MLKRTRLLWLLLRLLLLLLLLRWRVHDLGLRQSLLLRHSGGCWNLLRLHGCVGRLNVFVGVVVGLGVSDALNLRSRGVRLRCRLLLRS